MKRKKLTPKQRVLRKHPSAEYWERRIIVPSSNWIYYQLGEGAFPREAWADAARRLP